LKNLKYIESNRRVLIHLSKLFTEDTAPFKKESGRGFLTNQDKWISTVEDIIMLADQVLKEER